MNTETEADLRQGLEVRAADADRDSEIVITVASDTRIMPRCSDLLAERYIAVTYRSASA